MERLDFKPLSHTACQLGESPRWHAGEERLYWTDIDGRTLWRIRLDGGGAESAALEQKAGCIVLRERGGLVLAMEDGVYAGDPFGGGGLEQLCPHPDPAFAAKGGRFNDGRCDARGRLWVGTMDPERKGQAALYRLDPKDMRMEAMQEGFSTFNGLAFHPNGREAWYADSRQWSLYRSSFDLEQGTIGPRELLREWPKERSPARPDGAAFDRDGCYWTALFEGAGVARLDGDGEIVFEQGVPAGFPTMPCFAGPGLAQLAVTSALGSEPEAELAQNPAAGRVLLARTAVAGLPEPAFAG